LPKLSAAGLAGAALAAALLLTACSDEGPPPATPTPSADVSASPTIPSSPTTAPTRQPDSSSPRPFPRKPASDDGEIWGIILTLTSGHISPVLHPGEPLSGFETVRIAEPPEEESVAYSFVVEYSGPGKWLRIGAGASNPPPAGPNGYQRAVQIRGLECAPDKGRGCTLQVDDQANPEQAVWLWWNEPGTSVAVSSGAPQGSVFYLVSAHGIDPAEVTRVAQSLRPAFVRTCQAGDLDAILGAPNALTGGHRTAEIVFGNKSETACSLEGVPEVQLFAGPDPISSIEIFSWCETHNAPCRLRQTVALEPRTGDLDPRESRPGRARVQMYWPMYDADGPPCNTGPGAVTIRIVLGDGALDVGSVSPCERLGVGWFAPTGH
jgi:hypothetical protein